MVPGSELCAKASAIAAASAAKTTAPATSLHVGQRAVVHFGKAIAPGVAFTQPSKINNRGQIVGSTLSDAALADFHGFLLAKGPSDPFTPIDFPGAPRTVAVGINDRAQIVGAYENPDAPPDRQPSPMGMPMMTMSGR
jgi:hypothetical protein